MGSKLRESRSSRKLGIIDKNCTGSSPSTFNVLCLLDVEPHPESFRLIVPRLSFLLEFLPSTRGNHHIARIQDCPWCLSLEAA
ncbi:hypothetical protein Y032_0069g346 [Ancylostoma ceylanicum]|uniref:Uncharacterized protein n=1 Tax=Ancylostoma ceylanicum TaxID=53326 RepID=A0A016TYK8_9BILA|nr:hypothetical protein Y032_0069g346 [Ancylostoma ceylanicum]